MRLGRRVSSPLLAVLLVALAAACERKPDPLPELVQVPDFELVDRTGSTFRGADMDGHVWVVDFIFTNCVTYCPRMTERMRALRDDVAGAGVRFMSVSVDPEHDTPEVLTAYARKNDALHDDWVFLTGDTKEVTRTVVQGFRTPMGERVPHGDDGAYDILHAQHFLLVDDDRTVRGYYRTDTDHLERLARDARRLARDGGSP